MSDAFWTAYKHPKWQKKRLELLQMADFACEDCGAADETLEVHHKHYIKGKKPWEYDDIAYEVVCTGCHKKRTKVKRAINDFWQYFSGADLERIYGYLAGIAMQTEHFAHGAGIHLESFEFAWGVCDSHIENSPHPRIDKLIAETGPEHIAYPLHVGAGFELSQDGPELL